VVAFEEPDIEQEKRDLLKGNAELKRQQFAIEEKILTLLNQKLDPVRASTQH